MSNCEHNINRPVTPYEIAKHLQGSHSIEIAPQRIYRDRQDSRLIAYKLGGTGKWVVEPEIAREYIDKVLSGTSKKEDPFS